MDLRAEPNTPSSLLKAVVYTPLGGVDMVTWALAQMWMSAPPLMCVYMHTVLPSLKQTGDMSRGNSPCRCLPVRMRGLDEVRAVRVACGWRHSMIIDDRGQLFCVGWGKYGQLGLGDGETRSIPVPVCMPQKEPVRSAHALSRNTRLHACLPMQFSCRLFLWMVVGGTLWWPQPLHCTLVDGISLDSSVLGSVRMYFRQLELKSSVLKAQQSLQLHVVGGIPLW